MGFFSNIAVNLFKGIFHSSIRNRLIFSFTGFTLACVIIVSVMISMFAQRSVKESIEDNLKAIRDSKTDELQNIFDGYWMSINSIAQSKTIQDAVINYEDLVLEQGLNIATDNELNFQKYVALKEQNKIEFAEISEQYQISNFSIITTSGFVLVQSEPDYFLGKNLKNGAAKNTNLANCFNKGQQEVYFEDLHYSTEHKRLTAYMCIPILSKYERSGHGRNDLLGILAIEVDWKKMMILVSFRSGLGETGEIYIVGDDKMLRTDTLNAVTEYNIINSFTSDMKINTQATQDLFDNNMDEGIAEIKNYVGNNVLSAYKKVKVLGRKWAVIVEKQTKEAFATMYNLQYFVLIFILVLFVLVVFVARLLGNSISVPILDAAKLLDRMGQQDFNVRVDDISLNRKDEIGTITRAIQKICDSVSEAMAKIKLSSSELISATKEVSKIAHQISEGTNQQSVSFKELASSTNVNASSANEANEVAQVTASSAEQTRANMQKTIEAMNSIETSSTQISKSVDFITDIAEQTNLLALNAAIEAARAGEHGRGFAVVADEIRKLAESSGQSANEITQLVESSLKEVSQGVKISKDAGESLQSIITDIGKIAEQLSFIAASVQQEAAAMEENSAITESNSQSAETLSSIVEQLTKQTNGFQELVGIFRVKHSGKDDITV
ncbi:MAG: methyl-accepting chemotaxis protein [Oligoflexia bacterium]|nr:methyl-accepting chemotaxis protein [Oligoflexia bacterium]